MYVDGHVADTLHKRGQAEGEVLDGCVYFDAAPFREGFQVAGNAVEAGVGLGELTLEASELVAAGSDMLGDAGEACVGERQREPVAGG
jgi:hypothetical protein